ncbi:unnamed protein product [Polarella glacialis]|uniref:Uncharacterized protein n=1 Tax=Polarella glacialis TaxID=89957 RepID=A0A813LEC0_POLGL|nr:unnamed protein product [Polarella glacialis]
MHHGNYAIPELRPMLFEMHGEHLDLINQINLTFEERSEAEKFEVYAGYVQHATLGPVFWPRPWLVSKFGLDRFELGRLNAALPCSSELAGHCATLGRPLCANCGLVAWGLSQASHKKLVEGCLKRLVALWISGRTDSKSKVEGHILCRSISAGLRARTKGKRALQTECWPWFDVGPIWTPGRMVGRGRGSNSKAAYNEQSDPR